MGAIHLPSVILVLLCNWTGLVANAVEFVSGPTVFVLERFSSNDILTRPGCMLVMECSGVGDSVTWNVFGDRFPIQNTTSRVVITQVDHVMGMPLIKSQVIYSPILSTDTGILACTITSGSMIALVVSSRISVQEVATVVPASQEFDISDFQIGQVFPVLCQVITCVSAVQIEVLKGDSILGTVHLDDAKVMTPQFNLLVTEDLQGEHICRATIIFNEMPQVFTSEPFNITGTPRPFPTDSSGKPKGGGYKTSHDASPMLTLLLISIILFLASLS